jgi:hypothetical protein
MSLLTSLGFLLDFGVGRQAAETPNCYAMKIIIDLFQFN